MGRTVRPVVPEAELEQTEAGLVPASSGETRHVLVGAGDSPCSPEDTQDGELADARFRPSQPTRYRDGLLPDD